MFDAFRSNQEVATILFSQKSPPKVLDSFEKYLDLKTAKPPCLLQVVGGVVVAD